MNDDQLIELLKDILELESLDLETELDEEIWDSLAVLTFIASVNEKYDIVFSAEKAIMANKVRDLLN